MVTTIRYCGQAALEASLVYAYADGTRCLHHARRALDLLEHGSPRLRMRLLLNQALMARGQSLLEYSEHFAADISFFCEGSNSQLLGLLAQRLGRPREATERLEHGIALSERAGLSACAAQARLELALCASV